MSHRIPFDGPPARTGLSYPDFAGDDVLHGLVTMVARRDPAALLALYTVLRPSVVAAVHIRLAAREADPGWIDADLVDQVTCATFHKVWQLARDRGRETGGVRSWIVGIADGHCDDLLRVRTPGTTGYHRHVCDQLHSLLHAAAPVGADDTFMQEDLH
jgi:hypothetical protein